MVYQFLAQGNMGSGGSEEHTIGDDARTTTAQLQHTDEETHKEQLRLFGLGECQEGIVDHLIVESAREGRIGHDEAVTTLEGVLIGEAVLCADIGIVDAIEHQVHRTDT